MDIQTILSDYITSQLSGAAPMVPKDPARVPSMVGMPAQPTFQPAQPEPMPVTAPKPAMTAPNSAMPSPDPAVPMPQPKPAMPGAGAGGMPPMSGAAMLQNAVTAGPGGAMEQQGGILEMIQSALGPQKPGGRGLGGMISDAMAGATQVDPTAPGALAFAQGFAGSQGHRRKLDRRAKKDEIDAHERAVAESNRADRRRLAQSAEERAQGRYTREGETHRLGRIQTIAEIMEDLDPSLTFDQRMDIENAITEYGAKIDPNGYMAQDDPDQFRTMLEDYRTQLQQRLGVGKQGGSSSGRSTPAAPTVMGSGTQSDPYLGFKSVEDFKRTVPIGGYYINPADGRVLVRQK